jgi:hypothetical protein
MHDGGDENDYPETDAEWMAWLRKQLAAKLKPYTPIDENTWHALLAKDWVRVRLFAMLQPGPGHDPGDEDNRVELIHIEPMTFVCEVG